MSQRSDSHQADDDREVTVETLRTPPLRIPPAPVLKRLAPSVTDSISLGLIWWVMSFARHLLADAGYLAAHCNVKTLAR